jgi:hypothetical protein
MMIRKESVNCFGKEPKIGTWEFKQAYYLMLSWWTVSNYANVKSSLLKSPVLWDITPCSPLPDAVAASCRI